MKRLISLFVACLLAATGYSQQVNGGGTSASATSTVSKIVDDTTTNATVYPIWVTAATGNLPLKVSSTKIFFNPSTGQWTDTGSILLGATGTAATTLHVVDTGTATPRGITHDQYNTGTNSAQFNTRKARGTFATPLTIVSGDILGRHLFWGHDGSNFIESANIRATSTGTIAATRVPSQLEFYTSTDATPSVLTKVLTLGSDQSAAFTGNVIGSGSLNAFNVPAGATPFTEFEVDSTSTSSPRGIMSAQFNTGTDGARMHFRKARGTRASPTTVVTGDNLGRLVGTGYDGSSYLEMASIYFATEGTIAATRVPTNIQFWTATNAAPSVLTLAATINSSQQFLNGVGAVATPTYSFAGATTDGFYHDATPGIGVSVSGGQQFIFTTGGTMYGQGGNARLVMPSAGSISAIAAGTNQSITLTPSGTGSITNSVGIYDTPAATSAVFKTAGTTALTLDSSQNIQMTAGKVFGASSSFGITFGTAGGATQLPIIAFSTGTNGNAGNKFQFSGTNNDTSAGTHAFVAITPTYNQASGAEVNTDLLINRTQTAIGSGAQLLIDAQVAGSSKFSVSNGGAVIASNNFTAGSLSQAYYVNGRGSIGANSDGVWQLSNNAGTDFTRLQFGGATASFPAIRRTGAGLDLVLADNSAFASLNVLSLVAQGGSVLATSATGGVGYSSGAGGTVTQASSRTTGVTINKVSGAITLFSAAGSASYQSFTVTDSAVAATDVPHVVQKSGTDRYIVLVTNVAAGSFEITYATTGGTTTEQPVFSFAVLKAVSN